MGASVTTEGTHFMGGDYYLVIKGSGANNLLQVAFQCSTYNYLIGAYVRSMNSMTGEWNEWKVMTLKTS